MEDATSHRNFKKMEQCYMIPERVHPVVKLFGSDVHLKDTSNDPLNLS